jgi:Tfp pilus assembly protein PilF
VAARLALVRGLLARQDLDGADRELQAVAKEYPDLPQVHVQAGVMAASKKDLAGARAAFERALALAPASMEALGGITALDLSTGNVVGARARIDGRLATDATPTLLVMAARTYARRGTWPPPKDS